MTELPSNSINLATGLLGALCGVAVTFAGTLAGIIWNASSLNPAIDGDSVAWLFWCYVFPFAIPVGGIMSGLVGLFMPRILGRVNGDADNPDLHLLTAVAGAIIGLIISVITTAVVANWIRRVL